jgi:hypothetical protein
MVSLPPGPPVVLPEAASGAPPLHPAASSASLVLVGGVIHATSPSCILHHDAVCDHILSLYLTLELGRDLTLSNLQSSFTSGRFRLLVLDHNTNSTPLFQAHDRDVRDCQEVSEPRHPSLHPTFDDRVTCCSLYPCTWGMIYLELAISPSLPRFRSPYPFFLPLRFRALYLLLS